MRLHHASGCEGRIASVHCGQPGSRVEPDHRGVSAVVRPVGGRDIQSGLATRRSRSRRICRRSARGRTRRDRRNPAVRCR
jgi:hypothetical protein